MKINETRFPPGFVYDVCWDSQEVVHSWSEIYYQVVWSCPLRSFFCCCCSFFPFGVMGRRGGWWERQRRDLLWLAGRFIPLPWQLTLSSMFFQACVWNSSILDYSRFGSWRKAHPLCKMPSAFKFIDLGGTWGSSAISTSVSVPKHFRL